jgi:hypothetical protein
MIRHIPPTAAYALFAMGVAAATFPLWRLLVFGFHPTLDELLRIGCLQP